MGTWGVGVFENDAALDFVNAEIGRHVGAIEEIFADDTRFRLDEDAEGELMPRIELLVLLCEHCSGALPGNLDIRAWKARYLTMFDEQVAGLKPTDDYKQQRRTVIMDSFDRLIIQQGQQ